MTEKPAFTEKTFEANEMVFDEKDAAESAYILRDGTVEIRVGTRGDSPSVLTTIKIGDVFGELALLENREHAAAAIATEKARVLEVPRADFIKRLNASDPVMKTVVNHLVSRLREMSSEIEERRAAPWEQ